MQQILQYLKICNPPNKENDSMKVIVRAQKSNQRIIEIDGVIILQELRDLLDLDIQNEWTTIKVYPPQRVPQQLIVDMIWSSINEKRVLN